MATVLRSHRRNPNPVWLAAIVLLLGVVSYVPNALLVHLQQQKLIHVVREAGGTVREPLPLLDRIKRRLNSGYWPDNELRVWLEGDEINSEWLQRHDWLRGLNINVLVWSRNNATRDDLVRVIRIHPLKELYLPVAPASDELIAAIEAKREVRLLEIEGSLISDTQFSRLPLEELENLGLRRAQVTPQGMLQLSRCRRLTTIDLDASQLTAETADTLAALGTVTQISLWGSAVTDEHLKLLSRIKSLRVVNLAETRTTSEAYVALKAALPELSN